MGRALSAGTGEAGQAVAEAARASGQMYRGQIPKALLDVMKQAGLVVEKRVIMPNGAMGTELRFSVKASEFVAKYFREVPK